MGHAIAGFVDVVASIRPDQWDAASPCDGWSVFDVVDHVVMGDRFAVRVLGGATLGEAVSGLVGLDTDPQGAPGEVARVGEAALEAFASSLDVVVDHPAGAISGRRFIGFRIIDYLGHTWDVARGIRQPRVLDPAAVEVGIRVALAEEAQLETSDHFETVAGEPPQSQDATDVFLHLIGRSDS